MNNIKLVVFDFDGVFTDGKFYFHNTINNNTNNTANINNSNNNITNVSKSYNGKDAYALKILKNNNIKSGIITNDKVVSIENAPHIFDRLDKVSLGSDKPKLDILNEWLNELEITYNNVAYIGDDLPDIPILEKVGFSACPNDAIKKVKSVCKYICENNGGNGAVREFVDLIIDNNDKIKNNNSEILGYKLGEITAVIPVRKGSTRCERKNIRNFDNTNLLKLKIETLKQVKGIDKILVSSNCDEMLKIALNLGVDIHKRDEKYCTNDNPGAFFCNLANNISTEILMHVPVTTPFISVNEYNKIINKWKLLDNNYDSLNTVSSIKEFIWYNNESINYNKRKPPPSQELPDYNSLNFGCNIIHKDLVIKYNNIIGINPYLYSIDKVSSLDIDHTSDFITTELLHKNNIKNDNTCSMILKHRNDNIELVDCTIRDGGYLNNWEFTNNEVLDCYKAVSNANYNYFEIGFRTNVDLLPNKGKWCYSTEEDINNIYNKFIKENNSDKCKIAVMAKIGTVSINDFVHKSQSNISLVRVLLARTSYENGNQKSKYNIIDIKKAREFCNQLLDYGYEVCMNFGCGEIIENDEIELIASEFHNVNIKALYLADTYGGFNSRNLPIQLHKFYNAFAKYDTNISFGFHSHNNNDNAFDKTKTAIYHGCNMIDSCIGGLGRGAGNLKSEQFISYLYNDGYLDLENYIKKMTDILIFYNKYIISKEKYCNNKYLLSHPYYMISGVLSLHPNYINQILQLGLSVNKDINIITKLNKYTKENNERNYNKDLINLITNINSNDK